MENPIFLLTDIGIVTHARKYTHVHTQQPHSRFNFPYSSQMTAREYRSKAMLCIH